MGNLQFALCCVPVLTIHQGTIGARCKTASSSAKSSLSTLGCLWEWSGFKEMITPDGEAGQRVGGALLNKPIPRFQPSFFFLTHPIVSDVGDFTVRNEKVFDAPIVRIPNSFELIPMEEWF